MQSPLQIEFQGMEPIEQVRQRIAEQVVELETRFARLTACRVVVKAPSDRHRTGGLYEINIHVSLPNGRQIVLERTPRADRRLADLEFALSHAFKGVRRRVQDQVRRMQGHVKAHAEKPVEGATLVK